VAEEAKSVKLQVDNARDYAIRQGWTVADEHVFIDDGISGAEFEKRPGFTRMMRALEPSAPFARLIVSEQKSIGREMAKVPYIIKKLTLAEVKVYEYVHGRCLTPRTPTDKLLSVVQSYSDEDHRVKTAERMHQAHVRLARNGHVTGGRVFGYKNRHVYQGEDKYGNPLHSHVEREINKEEAAVVRRIFETYASGLGLKRIARKLTREHAPCPKYSPPKGGVPPVDGWAPSTVRAVLRREIYRGVVIWNKVRKRNDWGKVDWSRRDEKDWIRTEREDLRIISDELWARVASRRKDVEGRAIRFESGRLSGRPPKHATKNLLAGLAACGVCGGGMLVEQSSGPRGDAFDVDSLPGPGDPVRSAGTGRPYRYYGCARRRNYGTCSNRLRIGVGEMNEAILSAVEEHALTPEAIEQVIALTEHDDLQEQRERLDRETKDVQRRIARLLEAIEAGGAAASLVDRVREHEARLKALQVEAAGLRPVPRLEPKIVESRLAEWRRLLRASVTQGRAVLQRVLQGRITFSPWADGRGYDYSAETRFDKLFAGVVLAPTKLPAFLSTEPPSYLQPGDMRGTEHIRPEDTSDWDYEKLLERAQQTTLKGMRPWWDSNPRSRP
jgi:site-specific DNA recombinase